MQPWEAEDGDGLSQLIAQSDGDALRSILHVI